MRSPSHADYLTGRHILVVEDDPLIAHDLCDYLQTYGAQVIGPAVSVDQALHYVEACPHLDGVVLDVQLGEELSYPVADVLVERQVPFLFATAFPSWVIPSAYAGVARLRKPVDPVEVTDVLLNVMS